MKDLKYYVLGCKNNRILKEYKKRYFHLLQEKIMVIKDKDIKEAFSIFKENKDILLRSDMSSRIEYFSLVSLGEVPFKNHNEIKKECLENLKKIQEKKATSIEITSDDKNPYNQLEAHPDHIENNVGVGYGERNKKYWKKIYVQVFQELKNIDEGIYEELNLMIQKIIPLGTSDSVHNSASYKECIGQLYMGLLMSDKGEKYEITPLMEALIHESSHNKLNLINKFDDLLLNNYELSYYSPYRPDARHLWGVFLGVHAFSATIYYLLKYYKQNNLDESYLLEKLVSYNIKNNLSIKVLRKYGRFTEIGEEIMEEIEYVIGLSSDIFKELSIDRKILQISKQKVSEHFGSVKKDFSSLKY